jgi:hypothetical protein
MACHNTCHRKAMTKLRIGAHDLAIERGRYKGMRQEERICAQCSSNEVEDEMHFITSCCKFSSERQILYEKK